LPFFESGTELLFGRFVIGRVLGSGGMGVVHEARDSRSGRSVAIKTLTRDAPSLAYRFKLEFRMLADVVHPNLVRLYELFEHRGRLCMAMELLRGRTLSQVFERRPPVGATREIFSQIAEGVSAIHASGCLHRDLKPDNVIVTAEGRVVVTDFGLACGEELGAPGNTLCDGQMLGTPGYCAPEQGAGRGATRASDWYSFGVMLHEALAARPRGGEAASLAGGRSRPRPAGSRGVACEDLESLCARLLDPAPDARPTEAAIRATLRMPAPRHGKRLDTGIRPTPAAIAASPASQALREAYLCTDEERVSVAWLVGPASAAKTASVGQFLADLREREDAVVLAGRCDPREHIPFRALDPMVDALSRYLRSLTAERAWALLPPDTAALCGSFPALARIGNLRGDGASVSPPLRARVARARIAPALKTLLARIAAERPLVLCIEDAHHGDVESARLLAQVLSPPSPPPLLLLCCAELSGARVVAADNAFVAALAAVPGAAHHVVRLPAERLTQNLRSG